jgi:hypothetical protein
MAAPRRLVPNSRSGFSNVQLLAGPDEMIQMVDPGEDAVSNIRVSYVEEAIRLGFRHPRDGELSDNGAFVDGRKKRVLPPEVAHLVELSDDELKDAKIEAPENRCFVCGFEAKSERGLKTHRKRKHNI